MPNEDSYIPETPIPLIFGSVTTVAVAPTIRVLPRGLGTTTGGAASLPSGQSILSTIVMTGQEQTNWCWSAVTQSVIAWAGRSLSQSQVATSHVTHNGRQLSCLPPDGDTQNGYDCAAGNACAANCNDPHILSVILAENGQFYGYISQNEAPGFGDIVFALSNNKPVPCRVQWNAGGGHFILIVGWTVDDEGAQFVHVLDPASVPPTDPVAARVIEFTQFVSAYSLSGVVGTINYSYKV